ncbi:cytochrome c [Paraglaciecola aquimarina]|uniref:Cytochrome c n=1 Tax=Paraglaciecola aquimarina TaxID=1235557 RepID=A0ABU3SZC3_9ALTE|nr:cytochrome c [Paraglaciecola aquimarina]MDU0355340.1 cytochrome c [Paraglaciecola aquimarina]
MREKAFKGLCSTCHGADGKGGGSQATPIAPSFYRNPRVTGNKAQLINLVLAGMQGPINGKTYAGGMMPSIASNGEQYVADVLTYIRNEFDNQASVITKRDVEMVQQTNTGRSNMWTDEELHSVFSLPLSQKVGMESDHQFYP